METQHKWRAVPSTAQKNNPHSVRVDIVDDGGEFAPAFVAGDIMPEDARLMIAAPDLLSALVALREWVRNPGPDDGARNDYVVTMADKAIAKANAVTEDKP